MNRRQFVQATLYSGAASIITRTWRPSRFENDFTDLRNGIGIYENRGGTIGWMATRDALVVVDTQYPETATQCLEGLKQKVDRSIDLLINSHHHGDHTAGNATLVPLASASIAHDNVPVLQKAAADRRGTAADQLYVKSTYSDNWSMDVGKETVALHYYGPAHTGGDSVIHFQNANIAHMGDLVFNRIPPYIDRSAQATVSGWIDVLERAHKQFDDDTLVIHGHGNSRFGVTGDRADLLVMRDYLSALREYVMAGIRSGTDVETLAAIEKLEGFGDHFRPQRTSAVGRGVRAAYEEYSESR